jgi:hypothetical protein
VTPPRPQHRYRCRVCGRVLPAWLPAAQRPHGAMLLHHLGDRHPAEVGPYLTRMETQDIETVAVEASVGVGGVLQGVDQN